MFMDNLWLTSLWQHTLFIFYFCV